MGKIIYNGRLVTEDSVIENGFVAIENGLIKDVGSGPLPEKFTSWEKENVEGNYICPGFIDTHTHGGGGYDFTDGTEEAIKGAARAHLRHGTTTIIPTSMACKDEELFQLIDAFKRAKEDSYNMPHLLGLHLEGPFFSKAQAGAQPPEYLKNPSKDYAKEVIKRGEGNILRWSMAPELENAFETSEFLYEQGVLVSIAHTDADYSVIREALKHGFSHMTHFYSGMSTLHRENAFRILGAVECGYLFDELSIELIADGMHLPPELLRLIVKLKPHDKITLCTDSMRAATLPEGEHMMGSKTNGFPVIVEGGVAKLKDRSAFAGSVATTDRLVRTMVTQAGVSIIDAIKMISGNVAKLYGIYNDTGSISVGKHADIVILNEHLYAKKVFVDGKLVE